MAEIKKFLITDRTTGEAVEVQITEIFHPGYANTRTSMMEQMSEDLYDSWNIGPEGQETVFVEEVPE